MCKEPNQDQTRFRLKVKFFRKTDEQQLAELFLKHVE